MRAGIQRNAGCGVPKVYLDGPNDGIDLVCEERLARGSRVKTLLGSLDRLLDFETQRTFPAGLRKTHSGMDALKSGTRGRRQRKPESKPPAKPVVLT